MRISPSKMTSQRSQDYEADSDSDIDDKMFELLFPNSETNETEAEKRASKILLPELGYDTMKSAILVQYDMFMTKFENAFIKPKSADEILNTVCCAKRCYADFTRMMLWTARAYTPQDNIDRRSFHYTLLALCMCNGEFQPKIFGIPCCDQIFKDIWYIPSKRYKRYLNLLKLGIGYAPMHGNCYTLKKRDVFYEALSLLILKLDQLSQSLPDGKGHILPHGETKRSFALNAIGKDKKPSERTIQELYQHIHGTVHQSSSNTFTKCAICICLKIGMTSLNMITKSKAERLLQAHYDNVFMDRKEFSLARTMSIHSPDLLIACAYDGFSKDKTKLPCLKNMRSKHISDADLFMCPLSAVMMYRKTPDGKSERVVYVFLNFGSKYKNDSNYFLSCLLIAMSKMSRLPRSWFCQIDNFQGNKCYDVLNSLGWLVGSLGLHEFTLQSNEVGHTHTEIDAWFGELARRLNKTEVYTIKDLLHEIEKMSGVGKDCIFLNHPVWDFKELVEGCRSKNLEQTKIKNKHKFRIATVPDESNTEKIPVVKIASFARSTKWLKPPKNSSCDESRNVFLFDKNKMPDYGSVPKPIEACENEITKEKFSCVMARYKNNAKRWLDKGAINRTHYDIIKATCLNSLNYRPNQEDFETRVNNIRLKLITENEELQLCDRNNTQIAQFIKNMNTDDENGVIIIDRYTSDSRQVNASDDENDRHIVVMQKKKKKPVVNATDMNIEEPPTLNHPLKKIPRVEFNGDQPTTSNTRWNLRKRFNEN